jgi:hypothetical protein
LNIFNDCVYLKNWWKKIRVSGGKYVKTRIPIN